MVRYSSFLTQYSIKSKPLPGYAHAPFSPKFLIGFYSDWLFKMYSPNLKSIALPFPDIGKREYLQTPSHEEGEAIGGRG